MKFSLAFVAVLALTGAVRAGPVIKSSSELHDVFDEFLDLVPVESINSIVQEYFANDLEVQHVLEYMTSEDFKNLVRKVESIEDVINFYEYLQESGLDIYRAVNNLHEAIGLPPLVPGKPTGLRTARGGIAGLVADIKAALPLEDIKALYYKKLETSPAFGHLVERLSSPNFQKLIDALRANEEFRKIVGFAQAAGLDIGAIVDLLKTLFGLEFPEAVLLRTDQIEELEKDLLDFYRLYPRDEIQDIVQNYVNNDRAFQDILIYLHTEEFAEKLQELESIKETRVFLNYIQVSGLNVHKYLARLHDALEIPPFRPTPLARKTTGIRGFYKEMEDVLPMEEIFALRDEKLQNSPAYRYMYERMRSNGFVDVMRDFLKQKQVHSIVADFSYHEIEVLRPLFFFMYFIGVY